MMTHAAAAWTERLADGTEIRIRSIEADDIERQADFLAALASADRLPALLTAITELSPASRTQLCDPAYGRDTAFVATVGANGAHAQIGLARYAWVSDERGAELAMAVLDPWQRKGAGSRLLERLIGYARGRGIHRLFSIERQANAALRALAERYGAGVRIDRNERREEIVTIELDGDTGRQVGRGVREVLEEISRLERELGEMIQSQQAQIRYRIEGTKVRFEQAVRERHARLRTNVLRWFRESSPRNVVSAPFIYGMIVPFVILDISLFVYQAVCFRLYRVPKVPRSEFIVIDRQQLSYLNTMEKLNCAYCGYANGLLGDAREIAARTEQYWCPIKHARKVLDPHRRYARFADYGEAADYYTHLRRMRAELADERRAREDLSETAP